MIIHQASLIILRFIKNMLHTQQQLQWREVKYGSKGQKPSARWGHSMVKASNNSLFLFGGFGGTKDDSYYLNDLWRFSLTSFQWKRIQQKGQLPQARSNHTLHFNQIHNTLILFGGGSKQKKRFNEIFIFDIQTAVWKKTKADNTQQIPWQRTYHTSQFRFPYLIIHGGEGISDINLSDMWAYNFSQQKWHKIIFQLQSAPCERKFHSTALVGNNFYVIGGCNKNYNMLGDIYKLDLSNLLKKGITSDYKWECLVSKHPKIERWGNTCSYYCGQLYFSFGRINGSLDSSQIIKFDVKTHEIKVVQTSQQAKPVSRRRQASVIVGNSILIYGGYNGEYLDDFNYINLEIKQKTKRSSKLLTIVEIESQQHLVPYLNCSQQKISKNLQIIATQNDRSVFKIETNQQLILKNAFFQNLLKQCAKQNIFIRLPQNCDLLTFRIFHHAITNRKMLISQSLSFQAYTNLFKTAEYFCDTELMNTIEQYFLEKVDISNCKQLQQIAQSLGLDSLSLKAAQICIKKTQNQEINPSSIYQLQTNDSIFIDSSKISQKNYTKNQKRAHRQKIYKYLQSQLRFDIQQRKLEKNSLNLIEKTTRKLKKIFSKNSQSLSSSNIESQQQTNYFQRFFRCFSNFFTKKIIRSQQQIQA